MSIGFSSFWEARGHGIFAVVSFDPDNHSSLVVFERRNRRSTTRNAFGADDRAAAEAQLNGLVGRLKGIPELGIETTPDLTELLDDYFRDLSRA